MARAPLSPTEPVEPPADDSPRVIVGGSYWTLNGVNVFSENLVRGLRAKGFAAEILLTEEDSDLITINDAPMPRRADVPMAALPVPRWASWGQHWGAMIRYLEDRAPCVYIPNSDWRHSSVSPLLSAGVHIVGVVHSDDPLHYDHVRRLGPYWDAIVTTSPVIARKTIAQDPSVADRTQVIPIGVDVPPKIPRRRLAAGSPLRVIYPGTLKQHQKRVLDLPKIVSAAAARQVPMTLTIAGGGPDEVQLRTACAPWVDRGLIRFLGVVEHDAVLDLMEAHDVFIMTSEFEGLPNALLEAMGRGCVPLVTDIESGIPDVVKQDASGYLVPVGDVDAFVDRLEGLSRDVELRRRMSTAAYAAVVSGRFRVEDMVASYAELCDRLTAGATPVTYKRPHGLLNHPPADVGGVGLFPVELNHHESGVGAFPSRLPDCRQFLDEVRLMFHPERSVLAPVVQQCKADLRALDGVAVIVTSPAWEATGLNEFSATLIRGLVAAGVDARILLTEQNTDLVDLDGAPVPVPPDVPCDRLPVDRAEGWGAHWGAMVRYLEDRAPCIYLPTYDWRHSVVSPLLSDRVAIVGIVPGDDPMHFDHVRRLGAFWNAVVAWDELIGRRLSGDDALTGRVFTIPYSGPDVARDYFDVFRTVLDDIRRGAFRRPSGTFAPPPRSVAGVDVFPSGVAIEAATAVDLSSAPVPISIEDSRAFRAQIRALKHPERSPLSPTIRQEEAGFDRLRGVQVIVGLPSWIPGGVHDWSAALVRSLAAQGVNAHILLTEADTELVTLPDAAAAPPPDVRVERLPVGRTQGWGAHWGSLIRYLEDRGPCIYIPNHDWRHSCVTPVLSDHVAVVGVLHDDTMHVDHARRLGRFWNALVTYDASVARRLVDDPDVASRLFVLPFVTNDVARDYLDVFDKVLSDLERGTFQRPAGTLQPPPGVMDAVPQVDTLAHWLPDYREFVDEICQMSRPDRSPLASLVRQREAEMRALDGVQVIVAMPAWAPDALSEFSATLVRGLAAAGVDARLLLTEEDTALVARDEPGIPVPLDLPCERLPVGRTASWGAHWGALIRYLEDRAPCIYLPTYDWRHSVVSPLLSDQVAIVGVVPADDPLNVDHVRRLGPFWNAVIAGDARIAPALADDAALAGRVSTIPCTGPNVARQYLELFRSVFYAVRTGAFRRPPGALTPPPRSVAGAEIFAVDVAIHVSTADDSPMPAVQNSTIDGREFMAELRALKQPQRSPLARIILKNEVGFDRLRGIQVIVGLPTWMAGAGVHESSAALVRGLAAQGVNAYLLLTETDTELVPLPDGALPPPPDVRADRLPVGRTDGWGAHWGSLIRYLEDRAPCIYLPNHDWRHSCVTPLLSDRVVVVGVLHGNDAMYVEHARRLGGSWNAIVTYDVPLARTLATDSGLASRLHVLPFVTDDAARDYLAVFDKALTDAERGWFLRPARTALEPPPRVVGGVEIFSADVPLDFDARFLGPPQ